jgi:copper(I)-binding protein
MMHASMGHHGNREMAVRIAVSLVASMGLFGALLVSAAAHEYSNKGVTVSHPWARATPGGAKVGGVFFEMKAAPSASDRLVGARSAIAGSAEIHSHVTEQGIAKMRRVDGIAVAGGKAVVLRPGGFHVMLLDLKEPLREGDLLKLTLVFERAGEIEVDATIEPIGATGPHGFKHQPGQAADSHGHKH